LDARCIASEANISASWLRPSPLKASIFALIAMVGHATSGLSFDTWIASSSGPRASPPGYLKSRQFGDRQTNRNEILIGEIPIVVRSAYQAGQRECTLNITKEYWCLGDSNSGRLRSNPAHDVIYERQDAPMFLLFEGVEQGLCQDTMVVSWKFIGWFIEAWGGDGETLKTNARKPNVSLRHPSHVSLLVWTRSFRLLL
jgi:hypothetical protein